MKCLNILEGKNKLTGFVNLLRFTDFILISCQNFTSF